MKTRETRGRKGKEEKDDKGETEGRNETKSGRREVRKEKEQ